MVAADDDRRRDGAGSNKLVERGAGPGALPVAEPADPGRQALERYPRLGHRDPSLKRFVLGEQLQDRPIRGQDVRRIAGERGPAERALALAKERPDERRHEPREVEGAGHPGLLRLGPDVVAVVEGDGAGLLERQHRPNVLGHRCHGPEDVLVGIAVAQFVGRRH